MASYDDDATSDTLLGRYAKFDTEAKLAVVQTLAARPKSGWKLALAIKAGTVPRADIPAYIPRQLRRVAGSGFVEIWVRSTRSPRTKPRRTQSTARSSPRTQSPQPT